MTTQYTPKNTNPPANQQTNLNISNRGAGFENEAVRETLLKWSSFADGNDSVVIHGESDTSVLKNLRNILLSLQTEFT